MNEEPDKRKGQANKTNLCGNKQEKQHSLKHTIVTESTFNRACEGLELATFPITEIVLKNILFLEKKENIK